MSTTTKLIIDGLLVAGFGVQHSLLATLRVKRVVQKRRGIEPLAWRSVESLSNVVYILVAASLWQPTGVVVWKLSGIAAVVCAVAVAASWLWYWQLHLFEYDCGLAFGSTTLVAQLAQTPSSRLVPWKVGSRRWIRFPVHTAFFGMFFLLPTMTADLLVLAIVANLYNVIGSVLYDQRLLTLAGETYRPYVAVTGLIWPPVYRAPQGAVELAMPAPQHWRRPVMHLPGLVVGVLLGGLYAALIGQAHATPSSMLRVGLAGLLGAVLTGLFLGTVLQPHAVDWEQRQTDLSTTIALAAATGVAIWVSVQYLRTGGVPTLAAYLPLWFTVQYLGHVVAFLVNRGRWSPERPAPARPATPEAADAASTDLAPAEPMPAGLTGRIGEAGA